MMLMVTKEGLKLWGSGMLMALMAGLFGLAIPYLEITEASLAVRAIYFLLAFPLAMGWVQRWFWLRR